MKAAVLKRARLDFLKSIEPGPFYYEMLCYYCTYPVVTEEQEPGNDL